MTEAAKFTISKDIINNNFRFNEFEHKDEISSWSNDHYEVTLIQGCDSVATCIFIKNLMAEFDETPLNFDIPDDDIWSSLRMIKALY